MGEDEFVFWLLQEFKESQSPFFRPCYKPTLSRALNLHLCFLAQVVLRLLLGLSELTL